jgi:drug/metabolite transporter (DMT)-like permease
MDQRFTRLLPHISLGASSVMLGMSFVAIRVIMEDVHAPATLGFLRYGLAVVMLLPLLIWSRRHVPPFRILVAIVCLGIMQFGLFHLFVNTALQEIPASRGAVIFSLIPIMTMLIAAMTGRDQLSGIKIFAALLSVIGVSLAIGDKAFVVDGEGTDWTGEILFFLAVCCGATYNSFSSRLLKAHAITLPTIIGMTAGCLIIFPVALGEGFADVVTGYSGSDWLWIFYLAGPAAAFSLFLFNWGLQQLSPSGAAIYVPLAPVAAAAFGATLLDEHLSSYFLLGLAFAAAGPLLVNWRRREGM